MAVIIVKNKTALQKMTSAGQKLSRIFTQLPVLIKPGVTTAEIDRWVGMQLKEAGLVSRSKGYMGYQHVTCISVNDEVVHGVPCNEKKLKKGDLVTVDICASWKGYCADMARSFFVDKAQDVELEKLVAVAQSSLDKGIEQARVGNRVSDISAAVQKEVEKHGFGVVRDFAGHGIGKSLHEEPQVPNYGLPKQGHEIKEGMCLAIEPMINLGNKEIKTDDDGWTIRTLDGKLSAHFEHTIAVTSDGPLVLSKAKA